MPSARVLATAAVEVAATVAASAIDANHNNRACAPSLIIVPCLSRGETRTRAFEKKRSPLA